MSGWGEWETLRRRVAVCGRVRDTRGIAAPEVPVYAVGPDGPVEPVRSRADGIYWFLDLPAGDYRLGAGAPPDGGGAARVSVTWDGAGNVRRAVSDLQLVDKRAEDDAC